MQIAGLLGATISSGALSDNSGRNCQAEVGIWNKGWQTPPWGSLSHLLTLPLLGSSQQEE